MYCYEIWVRSRNYHGKSTLTYTSIQRLKPGTLVKVDLKSNPVFGIIKRETSAPKGVAMKPIQNTLFDNTNIRLSQETLKLISWFTVFYPTSSGPLLNLFLPSSLPLAIEPKNDITPAIKAVDLPKLTNEQSKAIKQINSSNGSSLLHGITGSGKTRIYIELILKSLANKKSCLFLVPEIGLIPHIYDQISALIDKSTIKTFHSNLTQKQQRDVWVDVISDNYPLVIIGARSALFLPFKSLGLIVVDECHDDGYKQENTPNYHGLRVASYLAELHDAKLVFGSATPTISDYYIAQEKQIPIIKLTKIANNKLTKNVELIIVNKLNKLEFTRSTYISSSLLNSIETQLKLKQQVLLFLNRRGSAKIILCNNCGWRATCKFCELGLTFHEDHHRLTCHTCGYSTIVPTHCPDCKSVDIVFFRPGTKSVESEIAKLFPNANINRFDSDNLKADRLDENFKHIASGKIDIIIGTQILVKGFDIPKLGLVGIIDADSGLSFPDFTSEERSFQLISQAAGRVGRGHIPGKVVVQTSNPDSSLIKQAIEKDWLNFYKLQLKQRKLHKYPPFSFLLKLECSRKIQDSAINSATKLKKNLESIYPNLTILGPSPSFKEKRGGQYSWQLIIKSGRRSILLSIVNNLPSGWKYDIDPTHLL